MYGIFSKPSSGRGVVFHRLLSLIGVIGSLLFGILFLLLLPESKELWWDRAIVFLYCLVCYIMGFRNINERKYIRYVFIGYYVITTQVIWSMVANNFSPLHDIVFFVVLQTCAFSMRRVITTIWYLLYVFVLTIVFALALTESFGSEVIFHLALVTVGCVLLFMIVRLKCNFMQEMKLHQNLMKSMVSRSEVAIFIADVSGNIFDCNERAIEMFGYSRDELVDCDFKMLRKQELGDDEIDDGMQVLHNEKFWTTATILRKRSTEEFHACISITLIQSGRKKFLVYRVQDISDIKHSEAQLTAEKERAEDAAKAKAQFLAVMSHEIRTPLNGVIATASLLQKADLTYEQMEYVDIIKRSGDSLLMLINDILEFSKMENGKMELDLYNASVREVIMDVIELLRPHAESKGLQLVMQVSNDVPEKLWMDGHRLKQILLNLAGNAIKFTDKGSVKVFCEMMGVNRNQVMMKFRVVDSGIGIPQEKLSNLFEMFSQLDSSTSRKYGGTGLGLAISKQLVDLMDGEIHVKSRPENGTEFSFTIMCEVEKIQNIVEDEQTIRQEDNRIQNMRVLVAEDNDINKQVFQFMLHSMGVNTDYASNGLSVVDLCKSNNYHLVFMDMQMPEMDGVEAAKVIRATEGWQPIIVAISANAYTEDRDLCAAAGMNDFLPKPFDIDQLREMLLKWSAADCNKLDNAA